MINVAVHTLGIVYLSNKKKAERTDSFAEGKYSVNHWFLLGWNENWLQACSCLKTSHTSIKISDKPITARSIHFNALAFSFSLKGETESTSPW